MSSALAEASLFLGKDLLLFAPSGQPSLEDPCKNLTYVAEQCDTSVVGRAIPFPLFVEWDDQAVPPISGDLVAVKHFVE